MAKSQRTSKTDQIIQRFAAELAAAAREDAIGAVLANLQGTTRGNGAKTNGARRKHAKRSAEDIAQLETNFLEYVTRNPRSTAQQIAGGLGVKTTELALPIGKLLKGGKLRKRGERNATRYTARA
jgi:predicted HTH transcriptional regulator